jgi:hypothetical protein
VSGWGVRTRTPEVDVGDSGWIWGWKTPGGRRKTPERGVRTGGEGRIRCYRDSSMSKRVAPIRHLFGSYLGIGPVNCSPGAVLRGWSLFPRPAGRSLSTAPPFRAGVGKSSAKAAATGQLALPGTVLAGVRQGDTASDPLELRMFQHVQRLTAQMEFQVFLQLALLHGFPFFTASWPHCGAGESTEATRRIVVP